MAVLLFTSRHVFEISEWGLLLMVSVSVLLSALFHWIATSKTKRQATKRFVAAALPIIAVVIVWDCMWLPDWLCFAI